MRRPLALALAGLLLLLAAASAAGAGPERSPYIVNGTQAPDATFPWQVALVDGGAAPNTGQFCGGTLIDPDTVLTAAHCVVDSENAIVRNSAIDVFAGQVDLTKGGQRRDVVGITVHPLVDLGAPVPRNDAALLTLSAPVADAEPVDVSAAEGLDPAEDALWAPGDPLVVAGWGVTESRRAVSILREVELTRITDDACVDAHTFSAVFPSDFSPADMVCAGVAQGGDPSVPGGGRDSCNGDSGGGLLARTTPARLRSTGAAWRVMGIVSWGPNPCDEPGVPGVYTRAAAPAIRAYITGLTPSAPTPDGAPAFTGTADVGETVHCDSPGWGGAALDRERFEVYRVRPGVLPTRSAVDTQDHVVGPADRGSSLVCVVSGRTAGGQRVAESLPLGPVPGDPPPDSEDEPRRDPPTSDPGRPAPPVDRPAPAPAPPAPLPVSSAPSVGGIDRAPPRATVVGRRVCRARRCVLRILVSDPAPSSGVASVRATFRFRRRTTCGTGARRRSCLRSVTRTVTGRRLSRTLFEITTPRLPKGRHTVRVSAQDVRGNAQRIPTAVRLSIR